MWIYLNSHLTIHWTNSYSKYFSLVNSSELTQRILCSHWAICSQWHLSLLLLQLKGKLAWISKEIWIADTVLGGKKLRISITTPFLSFISILIPDLNNKIIITAITSFSMHICIKNSSFFPVTDSYHWKTLQKWLLLRNNLSKQQD